MARSTRGRRQVLKGALGAAGGMIFTDVTRGESSPPPRPSTPQDSTKVPGQRPRELGERSPFERPHRHVKKRALSGQSETPL